MTDLITDAKDVRLTSEEWEEWHPFVFRDSLRAALVEITVLKQVRTDLERLGNEQQIALCAALTRAEEAEGKLCRARDYLLTIKSSVENVAGAFIGYVDVDAMTNGLNESSPCRHAAIAEHEPGEVIAEITCPACGRELLVEHGDDEGEIGVLTK